MLGSSREGTAGHSFSLWDCFDLCLHSSSLRFVSLPLNSSRTRPNFLARPGGGAALARIALGVRTALAVRTPLDEEGRGSHRAGVEGRGWEERRPSVEVGDDRSVRREGGGRIGEEGSGEEGE